MATRRPDFELSEKTSRVIKAFEAMKESDFISWKDLSKLLGEDAQEEGRHHVDTARKWMRREKRWVFMPIPGEGIKRLTPPEIARRSDYSVKRVNRTARREADIGGCIEKPEELDPMLRCKHYANQAMLGYLIQNSTHTYRQDRERQVVNSGIIPKQDLRSFLGS